MMATSAHVKLGALVVATLAGIVVIALVLGFRGRPTDAYHAYFDESVQGLEVGALVKYRGVTIGKVQQVDIAPDHRHVHVVLGIEQAAAERVGIATALPTLRARLAILGITGLKIIDLDVGAVGTAAPPALPFTPESPNVATERSLLASIEESVSSSTERLPLLLDSVLGSTRKLDAILDDIRRRDLPQRLAVTIDAASELTTDARGLVRGIDRAGVPEHAVATLTALERSLARLDTVLARLDGNDGLVASARKATDAIADVGRATRDNTTDLDRTLRDVSDAARALRRFIDMLERQPDMLVKGRTRTRDP